MANEAYVAERVAEAAQHPRALLLGVIGAIRSSATSSANTAQDLGLDKEETQLARWIAIFRRGKNQTEFLQRLLEIIKTQEAKEEQQVQVVKGAGYYRGLVEKLAERIVSDAGKRGLKLEKRFLTSVYTQSSLPSGLELWIVNSGETKKKIILETAVPREPFIRDASDGGFGPVVARVNSPELMPLARRLSRGYEDLAERHGLGIVVTLYQDYA